MRQNLKLLLLILNKYFVEDSGNAITYEHTLTNRQGGLDAEYSKHTALWRPTTNCEKLCH